MILLSVSAQQQPLLDDLFRKGPIIHYSVPLPLTTVTRSRIIAQCACNMHSASYLQVAALLSVGTLAAPKAAVEQPQHNWGLHPRGGRYFTNTVHATQSSGGNATTPRPTGSHQHPHNQTTNGISTSSTSISPTMESSSTSGCALSLVTETTTIDVITTVYLPLNDTTTTSCDYCNATTAMSAWHNSTSAAANPTVGTTGIPHSYNITRGHWVVTETECDGSVTTSMTSLSSDSAELTATDVPVLTTSECEDDTTILTPSSEGTAPTTTASADTTTTASADTTTTASVEDAMDSYTVTLTTTTSPTSTIGLDTVLSSTMATTVPETDDHNEVTTATATTTAGSGGDTAATTTYVIDTTVMPVTTASVTQTLATTLTPTRTVCATDAPAGETPRPRNVYCGVHGLDVGNYFLAQYVNNKANEPVTLEGCWQFCKASNKSTGGCRSYDFYLEPGLDVPRCNLYGSSVAYALRSIDNHQPHWWFDLDCGSPTQEKWQAGHDHRHDEENMSALGLAADLRRKLGL
ncbi:hypothetical protein ACKVWC_001166 [Pyricularia oryzae]|uniref:Apple domain-containing protein n=1 Tax=Pyricularia grisea TaxID=148305 RepID=A0ABQ8NJS6_PYRGI|nr:hypothetical protein MCOR26_003401 [Pyricularia oryzae]KAI6298133.1 hypothetical protein MCOR33_005671 [Pyricularia grisea]KAI6346596.1 hypothetical protein MCOR28_002911 [Pyricularia oryzae]KAI6502065.1 hypothetical protein MCOR11_001710 [Pyricularia oryzae]